MVVRFVWNEQKARLNQRKHGVAFDEARSIFWDDFARLRYDEEHSDDEQRFVLLGMSTRLRVLAVCHCYRETPSLIRIISARKATRKEERQYYEKRI